jgi:hypothetical protein
MLAHFLWALVYLKAYTQNGRQWAGCLVLIQRWWGIGLVYCDIVFKTSYPSVKVLYSIISLWYQYLFLIFCFFQLFHSQKPGYPLKTTTTIILTIRCKPSIPPSSLYSHYHR